MKRAIIVTLMLCAAAAGAADVVLGKASSVTWIQDGGANRYASFGSSSTFTPTASSNLLFWVNWQSATNGGFLPDASGHGNFFTQSTVSAQCTVTNVAGNPCGSFDGNDWAAQTNVLLNGVNEFTVTAWIYLTSWNQYAAPLASMSSGFGKKSGIAMDTTGTKKTYCIWANTYIQLSTDTITTGTWVFVAAFGSRSNTYGYAINTAQRTYSNGTDATDLTVPWEIGATHLNSAYINGFVDDARGYNRRLSSNELVAVMNETNAITGYIGRQ